MEFMTTPEERFAALAEYPFSPNYTALDHEGVTFRMHHLDEGSGPTVLLMHGEPSWSYLYRTMIPPLVASGLRCVAPDLVGFGRSDKPAEIDDHTYERHVEWMTSWLATVDLTDVTLYCQDWGGLIGLRLVAAAPERFSRVIVANTGLPTGDQQMSKAFLEWRRFAATAPEFPISPMIQMSTTTDLPHEVLAGYDAPFPDESFKAGPRAMPSLVPTSPQDPSATAQRRAWTVLTQWDKPFLTAFSDSDPITAGGDRAFHKLVPGAANQPHVTIEGAGHFLQEDKGPEISLLVADFIWHSR